MKDKINILFACGYGVGSSAIAENLVKKALVDAKINAEVMHTAMGEMNQHKAWADFIVISTKLAEGLNHDDYPDIDIIEVVNVMDGKGIAKRVAAIVDEKYPEARKN